MQRRAARQRTEFLQKKKKRPNENEILKAKEKLHKALETGGQLPSRLRPKAAKLYDSAKYDDTLDERRLEMDDEYVDAGIEDPRILLTTSRSPSTKLVKFAKEMSLVFPSSVRINRGSYMMDVLTEMCRKNGFTDLIILHENKGVPDGMIVSHFPYGPTAYFGLFNTVLRHDVDGVSPVTETAPHLIFHDFSTKLGDRVVSILKHLFPPTKKRSSKSTISRTMTFANLSDVIVFRHHAYQMEEGKPVLRELGPRFEMRLFQIKLGTIEVDEAEREFVFHPFINRSKKLF